MPRELDVIGSANTRRDPTLVARQSEQVRTEVSRIHRKASRGVRLQQLSFTCVRLRA